MTKEDIKIAANKCYYKTQVSHNEADAYISAFTDGALSNEAKFYWFEQYRIQEKQRNSGQDISIFNQPLKPSECYHGKSDYKMTFKDK